MGERLDLVTAFAALDSARLSHMDQAARSQQLDAREALRSYVEALWQDVQRSGEHPEVGDKYQALALVRDLARSLTVVAFDQTHDGSSTSPGSDL